MRNKLLISIAILFSSISAFAEDGMEAAASSDGGGLALLGAGLAIGIAALGGGK